MDIQIQNNMRLFQVLDNMIDLSDSRILSSGNDKIVDACREILSGTTNIFDYLCDLSNEYSDDGRQRNNGLLNLRKILHIDLDILNVDDVVVNFQSLKKKEEKLHNILYTVVNAVSCDAMPENEIADNITFIHNDMLWLKNEGLPLFFEKYNYRNKTSHVFVYLNESKIEIEKGIDKSSSAPELAASHMHLAVDMINKAIIRFTFPKETSFFKEGMGSATWNRIVDDLVDARNEITNWDVDKSPYHYDHPSVDAKQMQSSLEQISNICERISLVLSEANNENAMKR